MSNQIIKKFHNKLNESKPTDIVSSTITILDGNANVTDLSTTLTGTNVPNYSAHVLESFVWMLGNFAHTTKPNNPIHGQTWYNTTTDTLQLYIGKDHENNNSDWLSIEKISFLEIKDNIVPINTKSYDVGAFDALWPELHSSTITAYDTIIVDGKHISSFIPIDTNQIRNDSAALGGTVADVLTTFSELAKNTIPKTITIPDNISTTIAPEDETRYRTTTDSDITITIDQMIGDVEEFFLFAAGNGNIKIQAGVNVEITQSQNGEFATSLLFKSIGIDKWLVFGNFGDYA